MDPVATTLVSAFVIGVGTGMTKVGEQAIVDAYQALKDLIKTTYKDAKDLLDSISHLERKPNSKARRYSVAEELDTAGALDDERLLSAAEAVIAAAEHCDPQYTIGVDWKDVKACRIKIGQIRARAGAIGFRAARTEISGDVEISGIDVKGQSGK